MIMRLYGRSQFFKLLMACVWLAGASATSSAAASFAHWDANQLVLDNGVVRRVVNLNADGISTAQLTLPGFAQDSMIAAGKSAEFSFSTLSGRQLTEEGFPVTLPRAHDGEVFEVAGL